MHILGRRGMPSLCVYYYLYGLVTHVYYGRVPVVNDVGEHRQQPAQVKVRPLVQEVGVGRPQRVDVVDSVREDDAVPEKVRARRREGALRRVVLCVVFSCVAFKQLSCLPLVDAPRNFFQLLVSLAGKNLLQLKCDKFRKCVPVWAILGCYSCITFWQKGILVLLLPYYR